jgi:hypothetical protein
VCASACLGGSGPGIQDKDDAASGPVGLGDLDAQKKSEVDLGDPFAILGLNPSHGPWTGGTRTMIQGRGFPSKLRVWIGATEIDPSAILATDPTRAAVTTPPGDPGPQNVRIRDDKTATERVLEAGFFYDAFVIEPDSGATSGGTRVLLKGNGTQWVDGTTVDFAGQPCGNVTVIDTTHLECETPAHAPGSVDVTVTTPDTKFIQARDAYVYNDSPDGYRGGLSGGILNGTLKVIALDNWTGFPIVGATVIAGSTLQTAKVQTTSSAGIATLQDPSLKGKVTVTIAEKCHNPMTFVDVPVERVTAYLDPVLDLSCASGDPPSVSGKGKDGGLVQGDLVFGSNGEVQTKDWVGVPKPTHPNERRAAYVFVAQSYLDSGWRLPDMSQAVTESSPGNKGYGYTTSWYPGNLTIYAVAGIEKIPPDGGIRTFQAYVMGLVRGVPVLPKTATQGVDIPMNLLLSHEVDLLPQPPLPTPKGPDRVRGRIALTVGPSLYAFLPQDQTLGFLPNPGTLSFVGQPSLIADLTAESYVVGASAVTGFSEGPPASIVQKYKTNNQNTPIPITGFIPVPQPVKPGASKWDGTHVTVQTSGTFDLLETIVSSGGGLVTWTIVSPAVNDFDVPDLAQAGTKLGLVKGPILTRIYAARVDGFSYAKLRYGWLYPSAWSAYAYDVASGIY